MLLRTVRQMPARNGNGAKSVFEAKLQRIT